MPDLTEQQIAELKTNGGFNEDDIELFDMYQLDYSLIKDLQNAISRSPANSGKPMEEINRQVIAFITDSARQRPLGLNRHLRSMINFEDTRRMASVGGKYKRKSRRTKRKGRKGRKTKRRK